MATETHTSTRTNTHHGTREVISWTVTVIDLRGVEHIRLFGEREKNARDWYQVRRKNLHRGHTITLDRMVRIETWVMHTDIIDRCAKPALEEASNGKAARGSAAHT